MAKLKEKKQLTDREAREASREKSKRWYNYGLDKKRVEAAR